jgi:spore germination protein YaaH
VVRIPTTAVLALMRDVPDPGIERYGRASAATSRGAVHVVRRGETLGAIARRYKTTVPRLQALNGLKGTRVAAGQRLTVRGSSTTARTSSATTSSSTKASAKKASTKKASARKTPAKKAPAKKASAKQVPAKKPPAKKPVAKTAS